MDLKLKDVAKIINVSPSTVRRWLSEGKMPAYRINNQYRFSRMEIEHWVMQQRPNIDSEEASQGGPQAGHQKGGTRQFSLYRALSKGGIWPSVKGSSKEQIIRTATKQIAQRLHLDYEVLTELLLDREQLMPTALNNGIGVPHTRDFLLGGSHNAVAIVFPEQPVAYGALDGQLVHTLFFLFACDDRHHLHLLAKIAHLANQPQAMAFLKGRPQADECLAFVREWEAHIPHVGEE